MNTYKKYCPNVFVALCDEEHAKGDVITLTTKRGKENEHEVHNFLGKDRDGKYMYSITRVDGFNTQEHAKRKADKLRGYASNADKRSNAAYQAAQEGKDFLALGEPIKVGHHSERRHRKLIERNWNRMGKSVAEADKAEDYRRRAEYWEGKENDVNLSMPESLDYFELKLHQAKEHHKLLKEDPSKRSHSMSLQYANKAVKDLKDKVDTAVILWGTPEEIKQLNSEKEEEAKKKLKKQTKAENVNKLIDELGGFFAFNTDQFREGIEKIRNSGHLEEGEKVTHLFAGLYIPSKNVQKFKELS